VIQIRPKIIHNKIKSIFHLVKNLIGREKDKKLTKNPKTNSTKKNTLDGKLILGLYPPK